MGDRGGEKLLEQLEMRRWPKSQWLRLQRTQRQMGDVRLQELSWLNAKHRAKLTPSWKSCHVLKVLPQLGSRGPAEHWLYKYLENFNYRELVSALFRSLPFQFLHESQASVARKRFFFLNLGLRGAITFNQRAGGGGC